MRTEAEIAWAAGLFEGEGCARVRRDKRTVSGNWSGPYFSLGMTDEEPVKRFAEIIGCGHIRYRANGTAPQNKKLWRWESGSKTEAYKLAVLLPWLSPRRAEAVKAALGACDKVDRLEMNRRIVKNLKTAYCICGRGPMLPGPLGKHRKACAA